MSEFITSVENVDIKQGYLPVVHDVDEGSVADRRTRFIGFIEQNQPSFEDLLARLVNFGNKLVGNKWIDGEDLAQNGIVKIIEREASGQIISAYSSYLHSIVLNQARDLGTRNKIIEWSRYEDNPEAKKFHEETLGQGLSPEEICVMDESLRSLMHEWLGFISLEEFSLLVKNCVLEVSSANLAQQYGSSESSMKAKLYRIKEKVRMGLTSKNSSKLKKGGV